MAEAQLSAEDLSGLVSDEEFRERLGYSTTTAWRLRRTGRLKYLKISGRVFYAPQHIAAFLQSCERGGRPSRRAAA